MRNKILRLSALLFFLFPPTLTEKTNKDSAELFLFYVVFEKDYASYKIYNAKLVEVEKETALVN